VIVHSRPTNDTPPLTPRSRETSAPRRTTPRTPRTTPRWRRRSHHFGGSDRPRAPPPTGWRRRALPTRSARNGARVSADSETSPATRSLSSAAIPTSALKMHRRLRRTCCDDVEVHRGRPARRAEPTRSFGPRFDLSLAPRILRIAVLTLGPQMFRLWSLAGVQVRPSLVSPRARVRSPASLLFSPSRAAQVRFARSRTVQPDTSAGACSASMTRTFGPEFISDAGPAVCVNGSVGS
jgi:hypothetical protein